jgi:hypothetical protein
MSETPFFKTRMGQRFYEHTMPELVKQLERLNELLERLAAQRDRADDAVKEESCHT